MGQAWPLGRVYCSRGNLNITVPTSMSPHSLCATYTMSHKSPTLSFAVTLTCLYQNGQNLAHKKKKLRATKRT